jgi:hypothetical protein
LGNYYARYKTIFLSNIAQEIEMTYFSGGVQLSPFYWWVIRRVSWVCATRSLVLYVCFVDRCVSFCPFSIDHCVVCPSSIKTDSDYPCGILKPFLLHINEEPPFVAPFVDIFGNYYARYKTIFLPNIAQEIEMTYFSGGVQLSPFYHQCKKREIYSYFDCSLF